MELPRIRRIPKTKAALGLAARALVDHLLTLHVHDAVSYAALSEIAGVDVQARRDILTTARDYVRTLAGKEFDVVRNEGLVCLADPEKTSVVSRRREVQGRHAAKSVRILQAVDWSHLSPLDMTRWLGEASIAGAMVLLTTEQQRDRLAAQPAPALLQLDPQQVHGLFRGL